MLNLFHTRFGPIAGCEKCELDTRCTELETGWLARKFSKTGEFCWRKKKHHNCINVQSNLKYHLLANISNTIHLGATQ